MNLQYTFCNEDTNTEVSCLKPESSILAIAGSGSRVIPLFLSRPKRLVCIDSCEFQLFLTEMRITAVKQLSYNEYCILLGYLSAKCSDRKKIFERLKIGTTAKNFMHNWFEEINWGCLIFSGNWERQVVKSSKIFKKLALKKSNMLHDCEDIKLQSNYLKKIKWRLIFALTIISTSSIVQNGFISIKHLRYKLKIKKTYKSAYMYLYGLFKFCRRKDIKHNYFYSPFILGRYNPKIAPTPEINEENYALCKNAILNCKVEFVNSNIFQYSDKNQNVFDFISLSNVLDYCYTSAIIRNVEKCNSSLKNNGIVFIRQHSSAGENIQTTDTNNISERFSMQLLNDDTPFYKITILQKSNLELKNY
ncbi:DUF3419 family protein [Aestuariibacter sp. GS-14]|uniref:DUF3419 family protein n=1 Tax=Aestuariibacter sp. GS-14 TaxID=2590670 RepID=UPI001129861A|nr:DUF3419 family protein [Aestuariibacter sp. GS-14]TPV53863.1 DUF3419 family protein [Aestuariibacter sp. GS-14]